MTAAQADIGSTVNGAICGAELAVNYVVKNGLEVVKEDRIRSALEDQGEPPVRVDATAGGDTGSGNGSIR